MELQKKQTRENMTIKLLFLRGSVPRDRDPRQIMFDSIDSCDDMWTQLANRLCSKGVGEIWYWNGDRTKKYNDHFTERWVKDTERARASFYPNIIISRGGFEGKCNPILRNYPNSFKVYYGAGKRFFPKLSPHLYDMILNDSPKQLAETRRRLPKIPSELFIKPAADNIFVPHCAEKKYDVISVCNEHPRKGYYFALKSLPKNLRILQVGKVSGGTRKKYPHIKFTGWIPRKDIPKLYGEAKISVCCCDEIDSAPRVIPESLACGCPILVLDGVELWAKKYINEKTGILCSREDFSPTVLSAIDRYGQFSPREYYVDNLSIESASRHIIDLIRGREIYLEQ